MEHENCLLLKLAVHKVLSLFQLQLCSLLCFSHVGSSGSMARSLRSVLLRRLTCNSYKILYWLTDTFRSHGITSNAKEQLPQFLVRADNASNHSWKHQYRVLGCGSQSLCIKLGQQNCSIPVFENEARVEEYSELSSNSAANCGCFPVKELVATIFHP